MKRTRQKKIRKSRQLQRASRRPSLGRFPIDKWLLRVEYYDWQCRYCRCKLYPDTLTVDHQIPVSRGGTNLPANLVPACQKCNNQKADRTTKEFLRYLRLKKKK